MWSHIQKTLRVLISSETGCDGCQRLEDRSMELLLNKFLFEKMKEFWKWIVKANNVVSMPPKWTLNID